MNSVPALPPCGERRKFSNRARLWLVHRAPAGGKPALRCSSLARHASSGMARRGLLALARLLLLTPSVSAQTCALLRSFLPSNAHRAREQPVAHCRLSAHLPVRLALVRAVSHTSHSVSHGVGHGVGHSVSHGVSHGVSRGVSTAVAADVRAGGAACVHHLCHDSHATPVTTCADRPPP